HPTFAVPSATTGGVCEAKPHACATWKLKINNRCALDSKLGFAGMESCWWRVACVARAPRPRFSQVKANSLLRVQAVSANMTLSSFSARQGQTRARKKAFAIGSQAASAEEAPLHSSF